MAREEPKLGMYYTKDEVKVLCGFASLAAIDLAVEESRFPQPVDDDNRQSEPAWSGKALLLYLEMRPMLRRRPLKAPETPPPRPRKKDEGSAEEN